MLRAFHEICCASNMEIGKLIKIIESIMHAEFLKSFDQR